MSPDVLNLIAQTGGTLGLAVFAIWMLNRVWELRLEEAKRNATTEREGREQLQATLQRNTEVMAHLCEVVERLEIATREQ